MTTRSTTVLLALTALVAACDRDATPRGASPAFLREGAARSGPMTLRDTAYFRLEATGSHEGDDADSGVDRTGFRVDLDATLELCFFDEGGQAHALRLRRPDTGQVVGEHRAGDPCPTVTLAPGDYVLEVEHAQRDVEGALAEDVFVRLAPEHVALARVTAPDSAPLSGTAAPAAGGLAAPATVAPCSSEDEMPPSGKVWIYFDRDCQGWHEELSGDSEYTGEMEGDWPDMYAVWPLSMKLGPRTTAIVYGQDYFGSPWWAAWSDDQPRSYAALGGEVGRMASIRLITPSVALAGDDDPVPTGYVGVVPRDTTQAWVTAGTLDLRRIPDLSACALLTGQAGFDLIVGPQTVVRLNLGLLTQTVENDSPEALRVPSKNLPCSAIGTASIVQIWSLANADDVGSTRKLLATTRHCAYCNFEGADLTGADFHALTLSHSNFAGTTCENANFAKAKIDWASFYGADVSSGNFAGAVADNANFSVAVAGFAVFRGARLHGARFFGTSDTEYGFGGESTDFTGADLSGAGLAGFYFRDALFDHANLSSVDFNPQRGLPVGDEWHARDDLWGYVNNDSWNSSFVGASFDGSSLAHTILYQADISCAAFTHLDATGLELDSATYPRPDTTDLKVACRTSFAGSKVPHDLLPAGDLRYLDLTGASFLGLGHAELAGLDFTTARMGGTDLQGLDLSGTTWTAARLDGARFNDAVLAGARFDDAVLTSAQLVHTDLEGASFAGAKLAPNPADPRSTGARLTKAFLKDASFAGADSSRADLSAVSLYGNVSLDGANFTGARLTGAYLGGVSFAGSGAGGGATLGGVELSGAILAGADLSYADLRGDVNEATSLAGAFLQGTRFDHANLAGADLTDAAVSFHGGTMTVKRLFRDTSGRIAYGLFNFAFEATTLPTDTSVDTTCPNGQSGPCGTGEAAWTAVRMPVIDETGLDW